MNVTKNLKNHKKDIINGYVYVEKNHNFLIYLCHII